MVETIINFLPLLISIFTFYMMIKRDNRSNPNLSIFWHKYSFTRNVPFNFSEWKKKEYKDITEDTNIGVFSYLIQNVGNLPANWGFVYIIDFKENQVYSSQPLYYIDVKSKAIVRVPILLNELKNKNKTFIFSILKRYLSFKNQIVSNNYATVFIFSDFGNSRYMLIENAHTLDKFKKAQVNLNFFHPIHYLISIFCSHYSIKQKNTYQERANLHVPYLKTSTEDRIDNSKDFIIQTDDKNHLEAFKKT